MQRCFRRGGRQYERCLTSFHFKRILREPAHAGGVCNAFSRDSVSLQLPASLGVTGDRRSRSLICERLELSLAISSVICPKSAAVGVVVVKTSKRTTWFGRNVRYLAVQKRELVFFSISISHMMTRGCIRHFGCAPIRGRRTPLVEWPGLSLALQNQNIPPNLLSSVRRLWDVAVDPEQLRAEPFLARCEARLKKHRMLSSPELHWPSFLVSNQALGSQPPASLHCLRLNSSIGHSVH